MNRMNKLKKDYEQTEIPSELKDVVNASIRQAKVSRKKRPILKQWTIGAAAAAALFVGSINLSPSFAQAMVNVPVLGTIVEVFTVQQLVIDEGNYHADVKTPEINGLSDEDLQASLNEKYLAESEKKYNAFQQEMETLKAEGGGHFSFDSGYQVLTDTDQLFTLARYNTEIQASGYETVRYDTIDKVNGVLLSLPALFKDDSYIETLNAYLTDEMRRQINEDPMKSYFIDEEFDSSFQTIDPEQQFYITADNKLVLSFDEYEIAPGYMGVVTFEIPTDIIKEQLVGNMYIK